MSDDLLPLYRMAYLVVESERALHDVDVLLEAAVKSPGDFDPAFVESKVMEAIDGAVAVMHLLLHQPRAS